MSAYDKMFPPSKSSLQNKEEKIVIDIEPAKTYIINSFKVKDEEKSFFKLITTFPEVNLMVILILLVINIVLPGFLNRIRYNDHELSI